MEWLSSSGVSKLSMGSREQLTWDQDPARHRPGQSSRLQALRLSGRWSLQCLVCTERVVLLCRG